MGAVGGGLQPELELLLVRREMHGTVELFWGTFQESGQQRSRGARLSWCHLGSGGGVREKQRIRPRYTQGAQPRGKALRGSVTPTSGAELAPRTGTGGPQAAAV